MRLAFLFFLLVAVITGSGYIYLTTVALCVTPIHYRIGTFDERFSITEMAARESLQNAEAVWESFAERELFIYDDTAQFTVNFIFDDRQEVAQDQVDTEARLDTVEAQNKKINTEFKKLEQAFTAARERYEKRVSGYNAAQQELNQAIDAYNEKDEPTFEEEQILREEQARLEIEAQALDAEAKNLNQLSAELNELAQRGNVLVEVYNQGVQSYNSRFGQAREFTQGDYQGDQINIYTFLDNPELVRVLVHEFGHALGISHVENNASMMYHMMSNQPEVAALSDEDKEAFLATCGVASDLKNRLITIVTQYFKL